MSAGAVRLKVCCIASLEEARLAVDLGASALGLVSEMPSGPGVISEERIAMIAAGVPSGVATFQLTCRTDADGIVRQHRRCRTNTIQLVDRVAPTSSSACVIEAFAHVFHHCIFLSACVITLNFVCFRRRTGQPASL